MANGAGGAARAGLGGLGGRGGGSKRAGLAPRGTSPEWRHQRYKRACADDSGLLHPVSVRLMGGRSPVVVL